MTFPKKPAPVATCAVIALLALGTLFWRFPLDAGSKGQVAPGGKETTAKEFEAQVKPGDLVELAIERLGTLTNTVTAR